MMSIKSQYKYVRNVKGGWQARVWDGRYRDHINLGIYQEERMAWHVVREYVHYGVYPDHLGPKYVRTIGTMFNASISTKRFDIRVGPYLYPEIAQDMLFLKLQKRYPTVWRFIRLRGMSQDRPPDQLNRVLFPAATLGGDMPSEPEKKKKAKRRRRRRQKSRNNELFRFFPTTRSDVLHDTVEKEMTQVNSV